MDHWIPVKKSVHNQSSLETNIMPPITMHSHQQPKEDDDIDVVGGVDPAPMSRTHKYRKFMKPLLERKRRARINSYLDELKDLMVEALQAEGETITKLEKADVLELTLRHLQKLRRQQLLEKAGNAGRSVDVDRYRAGYSACATEVNRFMATVPGVNITFGTNLMGHLGAQVTEIQPQTTSTPVSSPQAISKLDDTGYNSPPPSPSSMEGPPSPTCSSKQVWRPF